MSRRGIPRETAAAWMCACLALLVAALAAGFAVKAGGGELSALVRMDPDEDLAASALGNDEDFAFTEGGHYDGVYFYAIALDPFATGYEHDLIDLAPYRYGHAAYGWAAGLLSLGRSSAVPLTLLLVGTVSFVTAAWLASRLFALVGQSPWAGLVVALNPGLVYAVTVDTSEPFGAALMFGGLWLWLRERRGPAAICLLVACLVKEALVAVPLGLMLWELARNRAAWREGIKRSAILALGPVALAAWYLYLGTVAFERSPLTAGPPNLTRPFVGWAASLAQAAEVSFNDGGNAAQVAAIVLPLWIIVGMILLIGFASATTLKTALDGPFVFFVVLASLMTPTALYYPKDGLRNLAFAFCLLPALFGAWRTHLKPALSRRTRVRAA